MLIILPPSETKTRGGDGPPVHTPSLRYCGINPLRDYLLTELASMGQQFQDAAGPEAEATREFLDKAIGIRATQRVEHAENAVVLRSPTMPAIRRYTGVVFDALDASGTRTGSSLTETQLDKLAIGSALFGVLHPLDPIPYYRLSATSKIHGVKTMRSIWRNAAAVGGQTLSEVMRQWREDQAPSLGGILDFRSTGYANLGPIPGAVSLRVETAYSDGTRKVVSHFNKYYKGLVARELATLDVTLPADPEATGELAEAAANLIGTVTSFVDQHFLTEVRSPSEVTLIIPAN